MSGGHIPLTPALLQAMAREAAEQGIPLDEAAAHLAHAPDLCEVFAVAYRAAAQAEVA